MGVFIRWNGTVEWNGGMDYWNSGMTCIYAHAYTYFVPWPRFHRVSIAFLDLLCKPFHSDIMAYSGHGTASSPILLGATPPSPVKVVTGPQYR